MLRTLAVASLLFLMTSRADCADTILHGVQGFTLQFGLAKASTNDTTAWYVAGVGGFVFGALPDLCDFLSNKLTGSPRWKFYAPFHSGSIGQALRFIPAYGLHLAVDGLFHSGPHKQHWGDDWRLVTFDAILWVVTIFILDKLMG